MIKTVGELIEALKAYDPSLPIAVRANAYEDRINGEGYTSIKRRNDAEGIPLEVEVEDLYFSDPAICKAKGYDAIVCIGNYDSHDMEIA